MSPTPPEQPRNATAIPANRDGQKPRLSISALWALAILSLERIARGQRWLVLAFLFAFPTLIAALANWYGEGIQRTEEAREMLVFYMIPQALLPIAALVLSAGLIQDEVEEQTLTYLMVRPLPRWAIYLAKLLAVILVSAALTLTFSLTALVAIYWLKPDSFTSDHIYQMIRISALLSLACLPFCSFFALVSLLLKRVMVVGITYILFFEGVIANINFVVRKVTVIYHLRVLAARWLDLNIPSWTIDLAEAPTARFSLLAIVLSSIAAAAAGAVLFGLKEFRLKTPEGN